jgi:hypothetical protein
LLVLRDPLSGCCRELCGAIGAFMVCLSSLRKQTIGDRPTRGLFNRQEASSDFRRTKHSAPDSRASLEKWTSVILRKSPSTWSRTLSANRRFAPDYLETLQVCQTDRDKTFIVSLIPKSWDHPYAMGMGTKDPRCMKIISLRQQLTEVTRAIAALENLQRLTVAAPRPPDTTLRSGSQSARTGRSCK